MQLPQHPYPSLCPWEVVRCLACHGRLFVSQKSLKSSLSLPWGIQGAWQPEGAAQGAEGGAVPHRWDRELCPKTHSKLGSCWLLPPPGSALNPKAVLQLHLKPESGLLLDPRLYTVGTQ